MSTCVRETLLNIGDFHRQLEDSVLYSDELSSSESIVIILIALICISMDCSHQEVWRIFSRISSRKTCSIVWWVVFIGEQGNILAFGISHEAAVTMSLEESGCDQKSPEPTNILLSSLLSLVVLLLEGRQQRKLNPSKFFRRQELHVN